MAIGMKMLKAKYHLAASIRIAVYKILFGKRFQCGSGTTFRRFFNIYLEDAGGGGNPNWKGLLLQPRLLYKCT